MIPADTHKQSLLQTPQDKSYHHYDLELAIFPATENLLADISSAQETLNIVSRAEGFLGAYGGLQVENDKTVVFAAVWSSYEDHQKFRANTEHHAEFTTSFKAHLTGAPSLEFVQFNDDHTAALSAPVTEVVTIKSLKDGKTKEDLAVATTGLVESLKDVDGIHIPGVYGQVIGTTGKFYLLGGWDSIEKHYAATKNRTESAKVAVGKFLDTVEASIAHVHFTKFTFVA